MANPNGKKKLGIVKKILIGFAAFFGVIIVAVGVLAAIYWSDIKALYVAMTTDTEVIEQRLRESDKEFASEVKDYLKDSIRDYSDEEMSEIASGTKSELQVIAEIISENYNGIIESETEPQAEKKDDDSKNNTSSNADTTQNKSSSETAEDIVARHVANLYSYQSSFEGRISALAGSVSAYCKSYKANHPGITWHEAKVATVSVYASQARAIESECYAKVDAEVATLKSDLAAIGADTSIADTVQASAENTMSLKKSQVMSEYLDKMSKPG